ncbi:hypothetical protein [Fodinibius saliphilus]|uniref:hypothetical protein n=1 Tax=Fodinibius saliphilus TaxID=1920650 RepID=UPI001107B451|nr:hypothetical protein [Fodinibius saliphilus]
MKYVLQILSTATVIVLMSTIQQAAAQSDIDTNRMNRDINIMENVLEELFKTQFEGNGDNLNIHAIGSNRFGQHNINGTYLPNYGIIFKINTSQRPFIIFQSDDNQFSYQFQYGEGENGKSVTQESITDRIVEFLRDYASTIGQLSDDQKVMVMYEANQTNREIRVFRSDDSQQKTEQQSLPTISVVANVSDLKVYRSGDMSNDDFRNRLDSNVVEASAQQEKDLRVMANIFKTAFEDADAEESSFQIRGTVDYLKLDNFGALFSFDVRYANHSGFKFDLSNLHNSLKVVREDLERARAELEENIDIDIEVRDSVRAHKREEVEANRAEEKEKIQRAYEQFLSNLKSTIADYGRTLRSVESNQQIMVSVNLNSRYQEIPDRIDLQIRKSVLESSSRDEAIRQISVREY